MYSYFREEEEEEDACLGIISIDSLEEEEEKRLEAARETLTRSGASCSSEAVKDSSVQQSSLVHL